MKRPIWMNILGQTYKITYVDKPSDVDIQGRYSYWGEIDYWTRTIRIYAKDRPECDIRATILHEVLHAITQDLSIESFGCGFERKQSTSQHEDLDKIASVLADTLERNGWLTWKD